jgi:hypothetical protein
VIAPKPNGVTLAGSILVGASIAALDLGSLWLAGTAHPVRTANKVSIGQWLDFAKPTITISPIRTISTLETRVAAVNLSLPSSENAPSLSIVAAECVYSAF